MSKSSVLPILRDYLATLSDRRDTKAHDGGQTRYRAADIVVHFFAPLAFGLLVFFVGFQLRDPGNLIVGISIVAALMCATATLLFQIRMGLNETRDARIEETDKELVDQTFADVLWAILFGLLFAAALIVAEALGAFDDGPVVRVATAVTSAMFLHFVMVIGMCLKRLRAAYERVGKLK